MSKIRINELARELEVKPNVILDMLPEMGIAGKKTHSSSLDDDVAKTVRRRLAGDDSPPTEEAPPAPRPHETAPPKQEIRPVAPRPAPIAAPAPPAPPASPGSPQQPIRPTLRPLAEPPLVRTYPPKPPMAAPPAVEEEIETKATDAADKPPAGSRPGPGSGRGVQPLRPPLGGGQPLVPPVGGAARGIPIPPRAKPPAAPPPKPGQIISGPRQPLPPSLVSSPGAPAEPPSPGAPRPVVPPSLPDRPRRESRPPGATIAPGPARPPSNAPLRPPARPNLAGQPSERPVVPPRPDMVAKLARTPGPPKAPRSVMPGRPSPPTPGQPLYRGPVRPGQPLMRGPGGPGRPGSGGPGGPGGRGRPMHPTSPLREPPPPANMPAQPGRRHATKPGGRAGDRRRDFEPQEGRMRPAPRRRMEFVPPPVDREITIAEGVTVKELSEKLGVKANLVVKRLVDRKIFATINQTLDVKLAEELARDFGASTTKLTYEEETTHELAQTEIDEDREKRPPVVTIMGHVDHGKTSLLDAIRTTNVAAKEAGGITQHIGASHVEKNGQNIVFIDTPGHEAFTRMRSRGAKVTDIVILVVAADDGVMPQTNEAIDHAKAAKVPIIVAINKIDKPGAQIDRIKQQLSDKGLLAEDWGGDVVMVPVSAKTQEGLDQLLEMILLVAELQDLKANADRPAMGTVLEAKLDRARGPVATVLIRNGTINVGDHFICGQVFGKVRALFDDRGDSVRHVGPSMPVEVLGMDAVPEVGDTLQGVTDTAKAKQIVIYREAKAREVAMSKTNRITLEQFHDQLKEGEVKDLNIILKTDVGGTAEVLTDTLQKLSNEKVRIRVLRAAVGAITESDVLLASTSDAIIVGFNVRPERTATAIAEQEQVDIRLHTIIYELSDELKRAMTGLLDPVFKQVYKGRAEVREVFRITKVGSVAGCMVSDGVITRNSEVRLLRDNIVVHTGKVDALKRFKNDASEVKAGFECGISIVNYNDIKTGDIIEAFVTERVAQEAMA